MIIKNTNITSKCWVCESPFKNAVYNLIKSKKVCSDCYLEYMIKNEALEKFAEGFDKIIAKYNAKLDAENDKTTPRAPDFATIIFYKEWEKDEGFRQFVEEMESEEKEDKETS